MIRLVMPLTAVDCRRFLDQYDSTLTRRIEGHKTKGAKDLLSLESWRLSELSKSVRERKPAHMTKEELEKLMQCKL